MKIKIYTTKERYPAIIFDDNSDYILYNFKVELNEEESKSTSLILSQTDINEDERRVIESKFFGGSFNQCDVSIESARLLWSHLIRKKWKNVKRMSEMVSRK